MTNSESPSAAETTGSDVSRVYLIGFRGCGKTTVARELARVLNYEWIDLDKRIEKKAGKSVREIFATLGEEAFRDFEEAVLIEASECPGPALVSTGGGIVLREANTRRMRATGQVIWLTAGWQEIQRRLRADPTTEEARPVLTDAESALDEVQKVLESRTPLYEGCASLQVVTDDRTIPDIVTEIMEKLGGRG